MASDFISKKVAQALNAQINREFQAAYLYLSMSLYCDSRNMDGFANWMRVQAKEEITHGMKIYRYLSDMGADAQMLALPQPRGEFASFVEVFQQAVQNEKEVAQSLNSIATLALEEKDQITYSFLKWFLDEQIEEIALTNSVLEKVRLVGDNGNGLLLLNQEFGQRTGEEEGAEE